MNQEETTKLELRITELGNEIIAKKQEFYELKRQMPRFEVPDYELLTAGGETVHLSDIFGDKNELILIHNMGKKCPYCTLWADGFNGIFHHLESRAAFAVASPDEPAEMKAFAEGRGWKFRMVSTRPSTLKKDLGFELENGSYYPGVSTFLKDEKGIIRHVAKAYLGPGDDFCSVWYLFDLLAVTNEDWAPGFTYK
jgi:predicted dithiol-disulfide oxidoreductase (DUF899 family)